MAVEFGLLGEVTATVDGRAVDLGHARQRCVLAALLVDANRGVSIDQLVERVWWDRPPQRAREVLHTYLSRLRTLLRPTGEAQLVRRPAGYVLNVDEERVDLHRYDRLIAAARAGNDPARTLATYAEAFALWRGTPFSGTDSTWLVGVRDALLRRKFTAALDRNDVALALGQHALILEEVTAAAQEQPLDERVAGQLMLARYRCGRAAEAIDAYHQLRRRLAEELGTDPGPPLRELYQRILTADPAVVAPVEPSPVRDKQPGKQLVGRETELARLRAAWAEAAAGRGRLVLLAGEAGIGKSSVARELAEEARAAGGQVLWGRAWQEDGAPSFWPWIQIVRQWAEGRPAEALTPAVRGQLAVIAQLVPDLPVPPAPERSDPATARFRLFDAVARWLTTVAAAGTTAVVIDDLHRADKPSQLLLLHLARELAGARVLLLATYRDHRATDPAFAATLATLAQEPMAERLSLDGLPLDAVRRLVEQASCPASLAPVVHRRTAGNPFFVREMTTLLARAADPDGAVNDVPVGVADVVASRIAELTGPTADVLAAASVLGAEFDLSTLDAVAELTGEGLDEAVAAGFLVEVPGPPGRYGFSHILVRDAVYGRLPGSVRARLHARAGTALSARHGDAPGPSLAELAHHFLHGPPEVAAGPGLDHAVRAGEYAMSVTAWEDAAGHFTAALSQPADPVRRCRLQLALGDAQMKAGDIAPGRDAFRQAARAAGALERSDLFAEAALGFSTAVEFLRGDLALIEEITKLLTDALNGHPPPSPAERAGLLGRLALAQHLLTADGHDKGDRASAEAVALAREVGDPELVAQALYARCFATWRPENLAERTAVADELVRLAERVGSQELILHGRHWQIVNALEAGAVTVADHSVDRYVSYAARLHQPMYDYWSAAFRGTQAAMRGRFDEAERLTVEAYGIGERLGTRFTGFENGAAAQLQALRWAQGRMTELEPIVASLVEQRPDMPAWRMCLAEIYATTGRPAQARPHVDLLARDGFAGIPKDPYWLPTLVGLADTCAALDDAARAATLYGLLRPFQGRFVVAGMGFACVGAVDLWLGRLATTMGAWARAERHLEDAREMHAKAGIASVQAHAAMSEAELIEHRSGRAYHGKTP